MDTLLIVGDPGEPLAETLRTRLRGDAAVAAVAPRELADRRLTVAGHACALDDRIVSGIVVRCSPDALSAGSFAPEDRSFCTMEVSAFLLAALHLPSVFGVNRYGAEPWFRALRWSVWRRAVRERGGGVAPFAFGANDAGPESAWYPHHSPLSAAVPGPAVCSLLGTAVTPARAVGRRLFAFGAPVGAARTRHTETWCAALAAEGVDLFEAACDEDGGVITVDTLPALDEAQADAVAGLIAERYRAHLARG